jgi:hypothetical protein
MGTPSGLVGKNENFGGLSTSVSTGYLLDLKSKKPNSSGGGLLSTDFSRREM